MTDITIFISGPTVNRWKKITALWDWSSLSRSKHYKARKLRAIAKRSTP